MARRSTCRDGHDLVGSYVETKSGFVIWISERRILDRWYVMAWSPDRPNVAIEVYPEEIRRDLDRGSLVFAVDIECISDDD